ncbi:MAG: hypothetical protein ABW184_01095 [Sphingobium sp.]
MSAALAIQAKQIASRAQTTQLGQGAILTNPRGLRRFRAALGDALFSPVHIGCYGDSITEGVGTENASSIPNTPVADRDGWPGQIRAALARRFGTFGGGAILPFFSGTDSRVTLTGSVTADNGLGPCVRGGRVRTDRSMAFTLPSCTAFDIIYWAGGSADGTLIGGFEYSTDGGSTWTTGLAGGVNASPGFRILKVTGLADAVRTVTIRGLHATNLQHVTGVRYHNSQGVVVSRWGRAGWTVLDTLAIGEGTRNSAAVNIAYARERMLAMFGGFQEHLTVISLGENDANLQLVPMGGGTGGEAIGPLYTTPDTYETCLRQIVSRVVAAGGCALLLNTALRPVGAVPAGGQSYYAYHQAARRIAGDTDHVAHLSMADRWGRDGDISAAESLALGMFSSSTSVHPSRRGYGDMANALLQTLLRQDLISG